jgi:hypothetical protein
MCCLICHKPDLKPGLVNAGLFRANKSEALGAD